jgi:tetratricopeptide (TPR) repeat protein
MLLIKVEGREGLGPSNAHAFGVPFQQTNITESTVSPENTDLWMEFFIQLGDTNKHPDTIEAAEALVGKIWQVLDIYVAENGTEGQTFVTLMEMLADAYHKSGNPDQALQLLGYIVNSRPDFWASESSARRFALYSKFADASYNASKFTLADQWNTRALAEARENGEAKTVFDALLARLTLLFGLLDDEEFSSVFAEATEIGKNIFRQTDPKLTKLLLLEARHSLSGGDLTNARQKYAAVLKPIRNGAVTDDIQGEYWRDRGLLELLQGNAKTAQQFFKMSGAIVFGFDEYRFLDVENQFGEKLSVSCGENENQWGVLSIIPVPFWETKIRLLGTNGTREFSESAMALAKHHFENYVFGGDRVFEVVCSNGEERTPAPEINIPLFDFGFFKPLRPLSDDRLNGLFAHLQGAELIAGDYASNHENLSVLNDLLTSLDEAGLTYIPNADTLYDDEGLIITPLSTVEQASLSFMEGQYYAVLNRNAKALEAFQKAYSLLAFEEADELLNLVVWEMVKVAPQSENKAHSLLGNFSELFLTQDETNRPLNEILWAQVYYAEFIWKYAAFNMYGEAMQKLEVVFDDASSVEVGGDALEAAAQTLMGQLKAAIDANQSTGQNGDIRPITFGLSLNN